MGEWLSAPSALRNRAAILETLRDLLRGQDEVLEIGSGTGEHAVYFAANMPGVRWQTSDLVSNHPAIHHWIVESCLDNVLAPVDLDVRRADEWQFEVDVVYSANTAHIMPTDAVSDMLTMAGRVLRPGGLFLIYGPFRIHGDFTSGSNARFDRDLRGRDAAMGIRDLEWVEDLASYHGMRRHAWYAMPSNNYLLAWRREKN